VAGSGTSAASEGGAWVCEGSYCLGKLVKLFIVWEYILYRLYIRPYTIRLSSGFMGFAVVSAS
jgi:hypothetical protein